MESAASNPCFYIVYKNGYHIYWNYVEMPSLIAGSQYIIQVQFDNSSRGLCTKLKAPARRGMAQNVILFVSLKFYKKIDMAWNLLDVAGRCLSVRFL